VRVRPEPSDADARLPPVSKPLMMMPGASPLRRLMAGRRHVSGIAQTPAGNERRLRLSHHLKENR
jgi:hypothetical protein